MERETERETQGLSTATWQVQQEVSKCEQESEAQEMSACVFVCDCVYAG